MIKRSSSSQNMQAVTTATQHCGSPVAGTSWRNRRYLTEYVIIHKVTGQEGREWVEYSRPGDEKTGTFKNPFSSFIMMYQPAF